MDRLAGRDWTRPSQDGVGNTEAGCTVWPGAAPARAYPHTRDGYALRLRAIGHLHEAEDESQEFPTLHAAIRDARKRYQTEGTFPDWEALGKASDAVRTSTR